MKRGRSGHGSRSERICIEGAREHNLKNISLAIPRGRFVVITGVSGSGKSTLAFDILFAEGQRRFLDSMNAYARQFVEQMSPPDVDRISGIPPTVSIEQRTTRGGGKSTVATVTEIHHFLRLLFARLGTTYCPDCQEAVEAQTRDRLRQGLAQEAKHRGDLMLLAPVVRHRKGFHSDVAAWAARHGFKTLRADGRLYPTDDIFRLDRYREHDIEIVVGVLHQGEAPQDELVATALELGQGTMIALDKHQRTTVHSTERACPGCGRSFPPLDPRDFSYNSPRGWCPKCRGFGELFYLPDVERGANADAVEESWWSWATDREVCPECQGERLNAVARAVRLECVEYKPSSAVERLPIVRYPKLGDFGAMPVEAAHLWLRHAQFNGRAGRIARDLIPELASRMRFLEEVGLGYLQLGRAVTTLSGGEAQRIRLAAQLGSNLSGVLYVLDEPTIGLHARDNDRLLDALERLRARGNSVVVVEHDEATMKRADHIIDLGPGAGAHGGQVVAQGTLNELRRHSQSVTGQCLRVRRLHPWRGHRRPVPAAEAEGWMVLRHAQRHNLKDITLRLPLGRLVVVTGVSGSGKSTLIRECLLPAVLARLGKRSQIPEAGLELEGGKQIQAVHEVDQSPIGRTPRSTPSTYVGFFDDIRRLFAQVPEARLRGYGPGRFSFNSPAGRCPECEGAGVVKLEMSFLPTAYVRCESCRGTRFNQETLDIAYSGRNVAEVLEMSVDEAITFFDAHPRIRRPLEALRNTGLGYLKLGQVSPTLSGGEAQRVRLVTHLLAGLTARRDANPRGGAAKGRSCLFLLEEPTIGLHRADVDRLLEVLQRLVDAGHSVLVIEHHLDLIAEADWVIDLGPEAGAGGGRIVVEGTPEHVAMCPASHTGRYLRAALKR